MQKIGLTSCVFSSNNLNGLFDYDEILSMKENVIMEDDLTIAGIYRNHLGFLKACVRKLALRYSSGLTDEDVEDIAQDTILKLHGGALEKYRGEVSLRGYLKIIARSAFLDFVARRSNRDNRRAVEFDPAWMFLCNPVDDILGNPEKTVDEIILAEIFKNIQEHLREVSETSRLIFTLIYEDGVPQSEVAGRLGISSAAVSARHSETLRYLRQKLERRYPKNLIFN